MGAGGTQTHRKLWIAVSITIIWLAALPVAAETGWKAYFQLGSGQYASVGASDFSSGYALKGDDLPGVNIGVGQSGQYEGYLHSNALSPFRDRLSVWCTEEGSPETFRLTWRILYWSQTWFWQYGSLPEGVRLYGKLYSPTGSLLQSIDFRQTPQGSLTLNSIPSTPPTGYRMDIEANPVVPEPSSLIALSMGACNLARLLRRRST